MIEADGTVHYYLWDRLGTVIGMIDASGALSDQYLYSPFGVEEPLAASGNPFRYTGRRYDPETGLYFYRARYYDPLQGRFLEPDPVFYRDYMNLYVYTGNDPLNLTDPTGESPFTDRVRENPDCGEACRGRLNQVDQTRESMVNAVAATRIQASPIERAIGDITGVYSNSIEAINNAAESMALTGDAGDLSDNFGNVAEVAARELPITATAVVAAAPRTTAAAGESALSAGGNALAATGRFLGPKGPVFGQSILGAPRAGALNRGRIRAGFSGQGNRAVFRIGVGQRHIPIFSVLRTP